MNKIKEYLTIALFLSAFLVCVVLLSKEAKYSGPAQLNLNGQELLCHKPTSRWYGLMNNFKQYKTLTECLKHGSRVAYE